MWFFPQALLCGLSTSVFKEKPANSNADRQTYRAAILVSHARGNTPATEVLAQGLGMIIMAKRSICTMSSYYLIQHLGQNVRLLSCKSAE